MEKEGIKIRPIKREDLSKLKELKGLSPPHKQKLQEQETSDSLWLIAWLGKKPIAHVQMRFEGSKVKKIKENLKCPHMEALGVREDYRKKGIATKIIKFVERLAKKRKFKQIGLSVEEDNDFLKNLCKRRGYKDWKKGTIIETWKQDGKLRRKKCIYLIKQLK